MNFKLVIVTTVPETLFTIMRGQPRWLSQHCSVTCITSPGDFRDDVELAEGVDVISVPMVRGISPFRDLISILKMYKVLRQIKPDIVHSYTPKAGLVAMIASFFAGIKVRIHTFTGLIFPSCHGVKRQVLIAVDKLICFFASKVVPEGEGVKRDLQNFNITGKTLRVIGYGNISGVDVEHYMPTKKCPNFGYRSSCDPFKFCFVGRLNKDKGVEELIKAFLSLKGSAYLTLVGSVDRTNPIDKETLSCISQHENIVMKGFLKDIRGELESCDVLVLPSYREGFPNVILQAGAMEVPVIASDINGCNEVIIEDVNGWLISPKNYESLLEKMQSVMELEPERLKKTGKAARQLIVTKYEQDKYRQKLIQFYRDAYYECNI